MRKQKVAEFTNVITGGTPSTTKKEYWDGGMVPWLNSGELNQRFVRSTSNYITELGLKNSSAQLMPPETVLLALTGATTGLSALLEFEASANQSVTGILPSDNHDSRYLLYYLEFIRPRIIAESWGGAQKHISQGYVKDIKVPLAELKRQKQIAQVLDTADSIRQKRKEQLAFLDDYLKSVFLDMFGDPVRNSMGRKECKVIDVCDCIVPGRDKPITFTGTIPWVTTDDLNVLGWTGASKKQVGLSLEEIAYVKAKIIPQNSVVMTCVGDLGVVSIAKNEFVMNQQLHAFICSEKICNVFLMYNLFFQKGYMLRMASSTTVPYMNKTICNSVPILLPPIELQNKFTSLVEKVEQTKQKMRASLDEMDHHFNALMQRYFG